jgi:serine/threonine-protein kinase
MHEARATAKLRGEHTVRVLDLGELESGAPFLVMERLEGSDLATLVGDGGGLPVEVAADYVMHACAGLAVAHSVGLIHRDIKPSNLFVDRRGSEERLVKVLDFGASKWLWSDPQQAQETGVTRAEVGVGSPAYVSPEQLENSCEVDQRSDIWSLGAVLFELLTGRVAFSPATLNYALPRTRFEDTPSLRGANVGSGLERVIRHCLEKDRSRRFPSVEELSFALQPFCTARLGRRAQDSGSSANWR